MQFPHICVLCNVNLLQDVCSWRVGVFLDVVNEASLYNQSHAEAKWDCRDSVSLIHFPSLPPLISRYFF